MLRISNERSYLLAKIGVDTAENEPPKVSTRREIPNRSSTHHRPSLSVLPPDPPGQPPRSQPQARVVKASKSAAQLFEGAALGPHTETLKLKKLDGDGLNAIGQSGNSILFRSYFVYVVRGNHGS